MQSFLSSLFKSHKSDPNQLYNNQNTLIDINNAIYFATNLFTGLPNIGLNPSPCFHINSYSHDKFYYFYIFSFFTLLSFSLTACTAVLTHILLKSSRQQSTSRHMAFFYFVSFTFSACTKATSRHMAFFYFVSFTFSACTGGKRLVLYINPINFTSIVYQLVIFYFFS